MAQADKLVAPQSLVIWSTMGKGICGSSTAVCFRSRIRLGILRARLYLGGLGQVARS